MQPANDLIKKLDELFHLSPDEIVCRLHEFPRGNQHDLMPSALEGRTVIVRQEIDDPEEALDFADSYGSSDDNCWYWDAIGEGYVVDRIDAYQYEAEEAWRHSQYMSNITFIVV